MGARYVTWIEGEEATVELIEHGADGPVVARVEVEGQPPREVHLDRHADPDGGFHLVLPNGSAVGGRLLVTDRGDVEVVLGDHDVQVRALAERDAWLADASMDDHAGEVAVSMPGLVVKVIAGLGEAVEAGQPVLIIEAMKMENEVKARRSGVVTAVHVKAGDTVEADVVLMEVGDDG